MCFRQLAPALALSFTIAAISVAPSFATEVSLPFLVLEDSNGDTIGPVVGFANNAVSPIIMIMDTVPNPDQPAFLYVRKNNRLVGGADLDTYFQNADCTGNAFIQTGSNLTEGLVEVQQFAYSVARNINSGQPQKLYRADMTVTPASRTVASRWRPCCDICSASGPTITGVPTAFVMDLDAAYPPPYQLGPTP